MAKKRKTIVGLLLDETGSMGAIQKEAVTSVREYVETLKNDVPKAMVLLATFNSCKKLNIVRRGKARDIKPIASDEYVPACSTPLYDSMVDFIKDLEQYEKPSSFIILVVMTDGYENASIRYSVNDVKEKIEEKTASGWEIVFLGADIDAQAVGNSIGTQSGSTLGFAKGSILNTTRDVASLTVSAALDESYTAGNFFDQDADVSKDEEDAGTWTAT